MLVPSFVGPSNTASAIQADSDLTINFMLESTAPGTAKAPVWLQRRPGIHPFTVFPDQPIRGLLEINERAVVVGGASFAELYSDGTFGTVFSVANDAQPASMASNGSAGHQVMVASGNLGYIYDLNALSFAQITAPDFPNPCRMCDFMDGYFLALKGGGSRQFQWSSLEDGTAWAALDVAQRSEASDNLGALIRSHREIWLIGGRTSEVWYDNGDVNNVFQPLQGVFVESGLEGPFTARRIDNTLMWMGMNADGHCVVYRMNGYTPQRVSTFAVETALQREDTPTDATAVVYQQNGHSVYLLILPRSNTTWAYDVTMGRWTEWRLWDSTACVWKPHVIGTHMFVFDKHLVGDRFSGAIYEMSQDFFDDQIVAP